jgi:GNAT superfamily N-acetyltransferase
MKEQDLLMRTIYLHDKSIIEAFLRKHPLLHLYELGDLDNVFWPSTSWYALTRGPDIVQIALLYTGSDLPILLYFPEKDSETAERFFRSLIPLLPGKFYTHLSSEITHCLPDIYHLEAHGLHYKMALQNPTAISTLDTSNVIQLTPADIVEVEDFYRCSYAGNWFDARLLASGYYYGIRDASKLVSVAGVHVYSQQYKVGVLGNVATHPDARGQGLATSTCARLCQELQLHVDHIGLNVKADNYAAISCYKRLGFEQVAAYEEYICEVPSR